MTTLTESLNRCVVSLAECGVGAQAKPFIPAQILRATCGVIFIKRARMGRLSSKNNSGMFMRLDDEGCWSLPVAVHFSQGDVHWGKATSDKKTLDLVVFITDRGMVDALCKDSEFSFDYDKQQAIHRGPTMGDASDLEIFLASVPTRRNYFLEKGAFSFAIAKGRFAACHIDEAKLEARGSSNAKYYGRPKVTMQDILTSGMATTSVRSNIVRAAQSAITRTLGGMHSAPASASFHRAVEAAKSLPRQDSDSSVCSQVSSTASSEDEEKDEEKDGEEEEKDGRESYGTVHYVLARANSFDFSNM